MVMVMMVVVVMMMVLVGLPDPSATLLRTLAGKCRVVLAKHDGRIGYRTQKFSIGCCLKAGRRRHRRGRTHDRGSDRSSDHCTKNTDCGLFHLRSPLDWLDEERD
jgi:hypothetical protein